MLKRTTEDVKIYFEEQGCKLLDEYRGCQIPMKYVCQCGREAAGTWNNFSRGRRCGFCGSKGRTKKWTIKELQEFYQSQGCEFLETEYHHGWQLLLFKCRCGEEYRKSLHEFKEQPRCWDCYMESRSGENHHAWEPDREKLKLKQLFKKKCYKALSSSLKATGKIKVGRTSDMLGYTPVQLQEYVTKHPNWESVKDKNWHLDHIFPIEAFVEYGIMDIRLINDLSNLQPILQSENNQKKDNYDKKEFEKWLESKSYTLL